MAYSKYEWEDIRDRLGAKESGGRSDPYDTIAYDVPTRRGVQNAAGIRPPKPISQMTMGELSDWQETQMRAPSRDYGARRFGPNDPRAKYGSTGVGRYQFERSTLIPTAEREFGKDWRNQPYSPENQERLAKNLWNNVRDNPQLARNTWAGVRDLDGDGTPDRGVQSLDRSAMLAKADDQYKGSESESNDPIVQGGLLNKVIMAALAKTQLGGALAAAQQKQKRMAPELSENVVRFKHLRSYLREQSEKKK